MRKRKGEGSVLAGFHGDADWGPAPSGQPTSHSWPPRYFTKFLFCLSLPDLASVACQQAPDSSRAKNQRQNMDTVDQAGEWCAHCMDKDSGVQNPQLVLFHKC